MKHLQLFILASLLIFSCKKENPQLGNPPSSNDADFTYKASQNSDNIIEFTSINQEIQCMWDFGNGSTAEGNNVKGTYPYAGSYVVKLTVFNKGGSKTTSKQIVINQDDLSLLDNPIYKMLTGGPSGSGYKIWHIDSTSSGHFGVGPDPESALGATPEWYAAGSNEKVGCGLYNDRYIFYLNGFKFDMKTQGDVYVHNSLAGNFPGSFQNLGDYTAPYDERLDQSWFLTEGEQNFISTSNGTFLGFYTGVNLYRIIEITDSTLYLQYKHHAGGLHWYLKLKSE